MKISASMMHRRLDNEGLYARRLVVCGPIIWEHRIARLYWQREHTTLNRQQWDSVLLTYKFQFALEGDSVRMIIWRERGIIFYLDYIAETYSYIGGGIIAWTRISLVATNIICDMEELWLLGNSERDHFYGCRTVGWCYWWWINLNARSYYARVIDE